PPVVVEAAPPEEAPREPAAVAVAVAAGGPGGARGAALTDEVGLPGSDYQRGPELPSRKDLLKLFVTDNRLTSLWQEIETVEAEVIATPRASRKVALELIDRLTTARNLLLHNRDQYENALREITVVKQRLRQLRGSSPVQQPVAIFAYLVIMLALFAAAF